MNINKLMCLAMAAVASVWTATAATVPSSVVTNEWRVAFDVTFKTNAAPVCKLSVKTVDDPASPRARAGSIQIEVNMAGRTRFFSGTVPGFSGLAWVQAQHFNLPALPPGETCHVEIVRHGDTLTVWQPADGRPRIFNRACAAPNQWIKAVEFADGPYAIGNLVIEPYGGKEDVAPKSLALPLPAAGERVRIAFASPKSPST